MVQELDAMEPYLVQSLVCIITDQPLEQSPKNPRQFTTQLQALIEHNRNISRWYKGVKSRLAQHGIWRVDHNNIIIGHRKGVYAPLFQALVDLNLFRQNDGE